MQGHIQIMEQGEANQQALLAGLEYLLNISFVRDDEILKICLDFWHYFVPDVYDSCHPVTPGSAKLTAPLLSPSQVPPSRTHTHTHTHTCSQLSCRQEALSLLPLQLVAAVYNTEHRSLCCIQQLKAGLWHAVPLWDGQRQQQAKSAVHHCAQQATAAHDLPHGQA